MKKHIFTFLICQVIFGSFLLGQKVENRFYETAYGTIEKREKTNALSFTTQNITDSFLKVLNKTFGNPFSDGYFITYKPSRNLWVKDKIILRIEKSIDIESDTLKIYDIFIFVETEKGIDLLDHNKSTYKKIKKYFFDLFNTTIKTAKSDPYLRFE